MKIFYLLAILCLFTRCSKKGDPINGSMEKLDKKGDPIGWGFPGRNNSILLRVIAADKNKYQIKVLYN